MIAEYSYVVMFRFICCFNFFKYGLFSVNNKVFSINISSFCLIIKWPQFQKLNSAPAKFASCSAPLGRSSTMFMPRVS
jgi:hypothetical protein